ncbi:MAG: hypothetical protein P9M14_11165 [Candidatus Alcyoniella australis]|nr:hypothetical protein [Candidatus Alcyoniella australis]
MSRAATALALLACLFCLGCAVKADVDSQVDSYQQAIEGLRQRGAIERSPQEMARAIVHLEAAREEADERDYEAARDHLVLIQRNLDRVSYYLDGPGPAGVKDLDLDGIPDAIDLCPTIPETVNGYNDDDGCPDLAF